MGSKKALLIVLGLILLSSSAMAVDFEWAIGDSVTLESRGRAYNEEKDSCFRWGELDDIARLPYPIIVTTESMNGLSCANRCRTHVELALSYNGKPSFYVEHGFVRGGWQYFDNQPVYTIADSAQAGGTCDWEGGSGPGSCSHSCSFDGNIAVNWVQIDISGLNSVFKEDGVKAIGSIYDLMGDKLPPAGETVYTGTDGTDVIVWIGKAGEEYNGQRELTDPAADDYVNVCADVNTNGVCDYKDAEPCQNAGADWYKDVCCGEDPGAIYAATSLRAVNCTYDADLRAFCGKTLDGRWEWAPKDDVGNIHGLLSCPGYSMVSNGADFINCMPGRQVLSFQQVFKSTCPAGTYTALSDYWTANYAYKFDRHPQSALGQESAGFDPDWHFDICTNFPGAKAKAFLAKVGENNLEPSSCDSGYIDIGLFSYTGSSPLLVKGRVCAPASALSSASTPAFTIPGILGTHEYICSNGEIFECAGDIASYTSDKDVVAETGLTTFELLGSGGCPPNIISYWTFDDVTAKDTKGAFNGNNFGATTSTGKVNGALSFDGTDRVEVSGSLAAGNEFSIEAWIRPTDTIGVRKVIEKGSTFKIAIDSGLLVGAVNTGAVMLDFGSRTVVPNLWHHVALTYDGIVAKLYLDGVPIEDVTTGSISWSGQPIIIGGNFIGDIDEVAIYSKALRHSLITLHAKNPSSYCQAQPNTTVANQYCAADGDWTTDLDIKDLSSCNKAGFHWTGTKCCSEMDDIPTEYYNEQDSPRADLAKYPQGKTTAWHAGAQVESAQITLSNIGHYVTISGSARLTVETYSAESVAAIGVCPKLSTDTMDIAPWESKTIKILSIGESGDPCRYRWKIITAQPILALGGCWNKTFVERGHLMTSKILNYQGAFFGCALPTASPFLALKDTHTNTALVSNLPSTCANIKLDAAGPGNHSVCGPGGVWLYVNDADATVAKSIIWDPLDYNINVLSATGCCSDDQCWDGFECVYSGNYYSIGDNAFVCR